MRLSYWTSTVAKQSSDCCYPCTWAPIVADAVEEKDKQNQPQEFYISLVFSPFLALPNHHRLRFPQPKTRNGGCSYCHTTVFAAQRLQHQLRRQCHSRCRTSSRSIRGTASLVSLKVSRHPLCLSHKLTSLPSEHRPVSNEWHTTITKPLKTTPPPAFDVDNAILSWAAGGGLSLC